MPCAQYHTGLFPLIPAVQEMQDGYYGGLHCTDLETESRVQGCGLVWWARAWASLPISWQGFSLQISSLCTHRQMLSPGSSLKNPPCLDYSPRCISVCTSFLNLISSSQLTVTPWISGWLSDLTCCTQSFPISVKSTFGLLIAQAKSFPVSTAPLFSHILGMHPGSDHFTRFLPLLSWFRPLLSPAGLQVSPSCICPHPPGTCSLILAAVEPRSDPVPPVYGATQRKNMMPSPQPPGPAGSVPLTPVTPQCPPHPIHSASFTLALMPLEHTTPSPAVLLA